MSNKPGPSNVKRTPSTPVVRKAADIPDLLSYSHIWKPKANSTEEEAGQAAEGETADGEPGTLIKFSDTILGR